MSTFFNSMDCSRPGSSIHGILQAGILEWITIPFLRGSSWSRIQTWISHIAGRFWLIELPGKPTLLQYELAVALGHCTFNTTPTFSAGGFPGDTSGKESICQCRIHKIGMFDPWLGRSPGGGYGNPLQYSCLENPTVREAWWATVYKQLDTTEVT